jgi:FtsP/CotA-like multicopper oxidase with cupredoxin domain
MHTKRYKFIWSVPVFLVIFLIFSVAPVGLVQPSVARAATPPRDGIICTEGVSPSPTFNLKTHDGYISLPDGSTMYMWGFSEGNNPFQYPGPVLCVNQGDTVTVILHNDLPANVSIIFPGQENVLADGSPVQPVFDGLGNLTSLTKPAPASGGSVTYSFVASYPGSYLYESGTDVPKQAYLGLFGALIVRPTMGRYFAYNRADSQFNSAPNGEILLLLSEIDPYLNQSVELGRPFNMTQFHPRYELINGRGFPDTIAPNFASWLPSQPYGSLARINPYDPVNNPFPYLEHYMSVASQNFPFHPHGRNSRVIGRDGHPVEGPAGQDLSFEKFSLPVAPGQTWDTLFKFEDTEGYDPNTNPVPVIVPDPATVTIGMFYSGSPYLGMMGPMPPGMRNQNECGEYMIIAHDHALFHLSSWGVTMTGPITFMRVDPPLPNMCP